MKRERYTAQRIPPEGGVFRVWCVAPFDTSPMHAVGEYVAITEIPLGELGRDESVFVCPAMVGEDSAWGTGGSWLFLNHPPSRSGTWCKLESVTPEEEAAWRLGG